MRDLFSEYYQPTQQEFARLWKDAIFVFDTNVLLNLYRYSASTRDGLLSILAELQERIWLPYHVGLEFSKNRFDVIAEQDKILKLVKEFEEFVEKHFEKEVVQQYRKRGHSFADLEKIASIFQQAKQALEDEFKRARDQHRKPAELEEDVVLEQLSILFQGKIGSPYSSDQMAELSAEFAKRYERNVPPG